MKHATNDQVFDEWEYSQTNLNICNFDNGELRGTRCS